MFFVSAGAKNRAMVLSAAFCIAIVSSSYSLAADLVVEVADASGAELPGASVRLQSGTTAEVAVTSDFKGKATFANVDFAKEQTLTVSARGFDSAKVQKVIDDGGNPIVRYPVVLQPSSGASTTVVVMATRSTTPLQLVTGRDPMGLNYERHAAKVNVSDNMPVLSELCARRMFAEGDGGGLVLGTMILSPTEIVSVGVKCQMWQSGGRTQKADVKASLQVTQSIINGHMSATLDQATAGARLVLLNQAGRVVNEFKPYAYHERVDIEDIGELNISPAEVHVEDRAKRTGTVRINRLVQPMMLIVPIGAPADRGALGGQSVYVQKIYLKLDINGRPVAQQNRFSSYAKPLDLAASLNPELAKKADDGDIAARAAIMVHARQFLSYHYFRQNPAEARITCTLAGGKSCQDYAKSSWGGMCIASDGSRRALLPIESPSAYSQIGMSFGFKTVPTNNPKSWGSLHTTFSNGNPLFGAAVKEFVSNPRLGGNDLDMGDNRAINRFIGNIKRSVTNAKSACDSEIESQNDLDREL